MSSAYFLVISFHQNQCRFKLLALSAMMSSTIRYAANSARKGAEVIGDVIQRVLMVPPQYFTVEVSRKNSWKIWLMVI